MAEITKRGDTYKIAVSLGYDENQKRIREVATFTPTATTPKAIEKEVAEFARDFEKRVRDGEFYSGEKTKFSDFVNVWAENFLPQKSLRTQEEYLQKIRMYFIPVIGHLPLSKIRAPHIDTVLNDMKKAGKAPKTIRYTFTAINSVMKYAYKKGIIKENPCSRCDDLPSVERSTELHYFTVEQSKVFLEALTYEYDFHRTGCTRHYKNGTTRDMPDNVFKSDIPFQWRAYFSISFYGGFRRGEIVALTWNDIDFERNTISINKAVGKGQGREYIKTPKTKAGVREIVLPDCTFSLLRQWRSQQAQLCLKLGSAWKGYRGNEFNKNYIFIDLTSGERMNVDTPTHKFKEIIELYNTQKAETEEDKLPEIRLHDLRHTSATLLLGEGIDIETVSKRLGHSKASVTLDIYGHALPQKDKTASDTLERLFA